MFSRGNAHIQMSPAVILCTVHVRASCQEATHGAHRLFCFCWASLATGSRWVPAGTQVSWGSLMLDVNGMSDMCTTPTPKFLAEEFRRQLQWKKSLWLIEKKGSNFLFSKLMKNRRPEISVQRGYLSAGQTFLLWGLSERSLEEVFLERAPPPRTVLSFLSLCCYIINHTTEDKISCSH